MRPTARASCEALVRLGRALQPGGRPDGRDRLYVAGGGSSGRVELELDLAHQDLVAGLETHPLKGGDHPDLPQTLLEVVERLGVLEVMTGDQQLDAATGDAETPFPLPHHVEALVLPWAIDAMFGLELAGGRGRGPLLPPPPQKRAPE